MQTKARLAVVACGLVPDVLDPEYRRALLPTKRRGITLFHAAVVQLQFRSRVRKRSRRLLLSRQPAFVFSTCRIRVPFDGDLFTNLFTNLPYLLPMGRLAQGEGDGHHREHARPEPRRSQRAEPPAQRLRDATDSPQGLDSQKRCRCRREEGSAEQGERHDQLFRARIPSLPSLGLPPTKLEQHNHAADQGQADDEKNCAENRLPAPTSRRARCKLV